MTRVLPLLALVGLAGCQEYNIAGWDDGRGSGDPPVLEARRRTDVMRAGYVPAVDVLWVLDDSCSMVEEQTKLADNLGVFFDLVVASGVDWHIGVVTTDAGISELTQGAKPDDDAGKLRRIAGYSFLSPEVPEADVLFPMMVRVGTGGAAEEMGLLTTYRALAQPTPALADANRGFLRQKAALHVIVISDEDDSSETWTSVDELANYLTTFKGDPDIPVTFSSIVGPAPRGCKNADTDAAHGRRYIATTGLVGGLHRSICEEDWAPLLEALGLQVSGLTNEYYLSEVPVPGSIRVRVDHGRNTWRGVEVTAEDEADEACADAGFTDCFGFRYDSRRNAVVFLGFSPPEGARVRVNYQPWAGLPGEAGGDLL